MNKTTDIKATVSDEHSSHINQLELALIIFVLRKFSSKENPLSAATIAGHISALTDTTRSEKTIRRKLDVLSYLQYASDNTNIKNSLKLTFGGNIERVDTKGNVLSSYQEANRQSRFYFEPLMTESDVAMICGAIASNRYLSASEKDYLLLREMTLTTLEQENNSIYDITVPDSYIQKKASGKQDKSESLLKCVNRLHDAIEKKYKVSVVYGIYDLSSDKKMKPHFHARNADKPYILNPYAMLWNNGAFYLLATHDGHTNPVHFRVDRIVSVKPVTMEEDATQNKPRALIPDTLTPFFNLKKKNPEFLQDKYTSTYPLMGIYDDSNKITCYIECTSGTMSILIDTFGTDLAIYPSPLPHSADETDFLGRPQTFIAACIRNVQYDNIMQFCLQQHATVTALHPPKLVNDIKEALLQSLNKYQSVLSGSEITTSSFHH